MNNNGKPLSRKQTVRIMVALTILCWATQTLLKQWGYGAELPVDQPQQPAAAEKFVPADASMNGATLEIRSEATIIGSEVKLRQVCRWSDHDQALFDPIGDLVLIRLAPKAPFKSMSIQEIRGILRDAGVNTAAINFAGAVTCTVSRSDVEYDEGSALQKWIAARDPKAAELAAATIPGSVGTTPAAAAPASRPVEENAIHALRDDLVADLANRLNLPPETLQLDFRAQDEKVLNISKPLFSYDIEPLRARALGEVMWNVSISADGETTRQKVSIAARARAWQSQLVVARPMTARQIIRKEDLLERRSLVEDMGMDPLLTIDQTVGQQAARELKPGMVMTSRMVDPVQLVKSGQFVTVTLEQGTVRIRTVARALEAGAYGQTVRVKNETTNEVFQVVLTGPQTATMNLSSVASVGGN